ncbi:hypothetical protein GCM10009780_43850 [Actinomadura alba]
MAALREAAPPHLRLGARASLVDDVYAEPICAYVDGDQDVTALVRVGVQDAVGDELAGAHLDPVQRRMIGAKYFTQEVTDVSD